MALAASAAKRAMTKRKRVSPAKRASNKRISEKIHVLVAEGKSVKQALGEAEGMEHAGRLRRHGVYVRSKKK